MKNSLAFTVAVFDVTNNIERQRAFILIETIFSFQKRARQGI